MHEQSETVGGGLSALFRNVYGKKTPQAGQTLPPQFPFEREAYPSLPEADAAAKWRSLLTDPATDQPRSGFGLMDLLRMQK